MARKEEIVAELGAIRALELKIEARIIGGLLPSKDEVGTTLTPETITERIDALAETLMADTSVNDPVLISLMDGAMPFASALHKTLASRKFSFEYTTMQVSSYIGTKAGKLTIDASMKVSVGARDVVVVDDVCDTGKTYEALKTLLLALGARSVRLMALVDKVQPRPSHPDYSGFKISKDDFIVGMGMDFDGLLRTIPSILIVDPTTLPTEEEKAVLAKKKMLNLELQASIAAEEAARAAHDMVSASTLLGVNPHAFLGKPGTSGYVPAADGWDASMMARH